MPERDAGAPALEIEKTSTGSCALLSVKGELDIGTALDLREQLRAAIREGHVRLTVDLADVSFLDSSGISVLIDGLNESTRREGSLVVRSPSAAVHRVLELTGLLDVFGLEES